MLSAQQSQRMFYKITWGFYGCNYLGNCLISFPLNAYGHASYTITPTLTASLAVNRGVYNYSNNNIMNPYPVPGLSVGWPKVTQIVGVGVQFGLAVGLGLQLDSSFDSNVAASISASRPYTVTLSTTSPNQELLYPKSKLP